MNEDQLKIQALTESLGELTQRYETKIAELRVEVTILSQRNAELAEKLSDQSQDVVVPEIEGKVV